MKYLIRQSIDNPLRAGHRSSGVSPRISRSVPSRLTALSEAGSANASRAGGQRSAEQLRRIAAPLLLAASLWPCLATATGDTDPPVAIHDQSASEKPRTASPENMSLRITFESDTLSVKIEQVPFRKVLAQVAQETGIKVLVANTVPDDPFSAAFERLPLEAAVKRLLAGRSYTARYATAPNASDNDSSSKSRMAEISIVPQGSAAGEPYRLVQVASLAEEEINDDAALLRKALKTEQAGGRLAALKKYLEAAEYADYTAVAEALSDSDSKVRELALEAMDNADLLPTEATAEVALTDTEPKFRMNALRLLVESEGGDAQSTITRALEDPDPKVRKYAREMAKLAGSIDAFRVQRDAAIAKGDAGDRPPMPGN